MNDPLKPSQAFEDGLSATQATLRPPGTDTRFGLDAATESHTNDTNDPQHASAPAFHRWEDSVSSGVRTAAQNVDSYIRTYPWGALLASAAVGVAFGVLVSRA
ncbi:hypothetical protein [Eleftheria terrae]|uniref:hypothetical protein n=1 Tax=Eleftheria terrae TaxID=1597781 RepID=UPI00263A8268|nr:hypothetical protein [Eleftheria terrae]WKB55302.1 hypothetical protein N7L95_24770 [Eleftheria terrae]